MYTRLAWNSEQTTCLCFQSATIKDMHHQPQLNKSLDYSHTVPYFIPRNTSQGESGVEGNDIPHTGGNCVNIYTSK